MQASAVQRALMKLFKGCQELTYGEGIIVELRVEAVFIILRGLCSRFSTLATMLVSIVLVSIDYMCNLAEIADK